MEHETFGSLFAGAVFFIAYDGTPLVGELHSDLVFFSRHQINFKKAVSLGFLDHFVGGFCQLTFLGIFYRNHFMHTGLG